MKTLILILASTTFVASCLFNNDSKKEQGIDLNAVLQGTYGKLGSNDPGAYYLIKVNLTNNSNSTVKFLASNCLIAEYFVTNTKEIYPCINDCPSNSYFTVSLEPRQQFAVMLLLTSKVRIDSNIKVGFVFLTPKDVDEQDIRQKLDKSIGTLENVIWSEPIYIRSGEGIIYEMVKK